MFPKVIYTQDGSLTFWDESTQQHYHNLAGAYTESLKTYAEPSRLIEKISSQGDEMDIRLLDVCFGLGYNTWTTLQRILHHCESMATSPKGTIKVVGLEWDISMAFVWPLVLEDPRYLSLHGLQGVLEHNIYYRTFDRLFMIRWYHQPGLCIDLQIIFGDLRQWVPRIQGPFDRIFHDPFSPSKAPQFWTVDLFQAYYRLLEERQGAIITYSAASAVRGGLLSAGFLVEKTPVVGDKPGGGSIGTLQPGFGELLNEDEYGKLMGRGGIPYRDPQGTLLSNAILANRHEEQSSFGLRPH